MPYVYGLGNVVANVYDAKSDLAEKALIAILTSGFAGPLEVLWKVVEMMGSEHTIKAFRLQDSVYEVP